MKTIPPMMAALNGDGGAVDGARLTLVSRETGHVEEVNPLRVLVVGIRAVHRVACPIKSAEATVDVSEVCMRLEVAEELHRPRPRGPLAPLPAADEVAVSLRARPAALNDGLRQVVRGVLEGPPARFAFPPQIRIGSHSLGWSPPSHDGFQVAIGSVDRRLGLSMPDVAISRPPAGARRLATEVVAMV
jgi:hypothetical protein